MTSIAFFAEAGPVTSVKVQRIGQDSGEELRTCFQTTKCLIFPSRLIAFRDDWWDITTSCTVAVNSFHSQISMAIFFLSIGLIGSGWMFDEVER
jgi:hypothetical protein